MKLTDEQKEAIKNKVWYGCTYASGLKTVTETNNLAKIVAQDIAELLEKEEYEEQPTKEEKEELEDAVTEVLEELKTMERLYKYVSRTLKNVGYAPFTTKDNIEMYFTLYFVHDALKKMLGNDDFNREDW